MTYKSNYSIMGAKAYNQTDITLWEAIKVVKSIDWTAAGAPNWDTVNITKGNTRIVAFFCAWTDTVKPAQSANEQERAVL